MGLPSTIELPQKPEGCCPECGWSNYLLECPELVKKLEGYHQGDLLVMKVSKLVLLNRLLTLQIT